MVIILTSEDLGMDYMTYFMCATGVFKQPCGTERGTNHLESNLFLIMVNIHVLYGPAKYLFKEI